MNNKEIKKPKVNKKTVLRLSSYVLKHYKFQFSLVVLCILISAVAGVRGSMFIQKIVDDYITPLLLVSNPDFHDLGMAVIRMALIYLIGVLSTYGYNRLMIKVAQGVLKDIRDEMFIHMQKLPIKYFDTNSFGDVMSRYTNDADTLRQMLTQSLPQVIASVFSITAVFFGMLTTSIHLTLIVCVVTCFILYTIKYITRHSKQNFINQQKSLGKINGYIEEIINGQKVVKVFCHEEESKNDFNKLNDILENDSAKANGFANILMPIVQNLGNLQYVILAIFGAIFAMNGIGGLTLGAIVSFLHLSKTFTGPIGQVSQQLNSVIMAISGAERIFAFIDEEVETDEGYVTLVKAKEVNGELVETTDRDGMWTWKHPHSDGTLTYKKLTGEVVFDDVDFGYNEDNLVLHNIDLYAHEGQKIAFVGSTGAGKTTITNLINRFYDIADGKIRYDGININKIKKDDLRRSLGVVLQDVNLFTGTIKDNIRYGKLDATDEEVYAAAKLANAHDFITRLPQGYDTKIDGNGGSLSQGQKQLISIARAAVANPPVMILDEATSSIDTRTEAIVQRGMDALMHGRTVFVIAHRLSTIKNSDVIMVLEHGRIIERGNHDSLIEKKGKYYQLYTGAFELE